VELATEDHRQRTPLGSGRGSSNGRDAAASEPLDDAQTVVDRDQTASDADQTVSDDDQTAADCDQVYSEADQRASDRDQAAADRDQNSGRSEEGRARAYRFSRADRLEGTLDRDEASLGRASTAAERLSKASLRDANASLRDQNAHARDAIAQRLEQALAPSTASAETARAHAAAVRAGAADDRTRAASDREEAARDRAAAARDREQAKAELRRSQFDHLTGAFGRELGTIALDRELNRASHGSGRLVLAFVDVDGLKDLNDTEGHAAGDALLRDVVHAIQEHLRSYDPIVRVGGDEFVCALADTSLEEARRRFAGISATIKELRPTAAISVGFAAMRPDETLAHLAARGDKDLYEAKNTR
jgi:diguanylate cyclase (GGDEF)-like protein